jgi:hypothetical protein
MVIAATAITCQTAAIGIIILLLTEELIMTVSKATIMVMTGIRIVVMYSTGQMISGEILAGMIIMKDSGTVLTGIIITETTITVNQSITTDR